MELRSGFPLLLQQFQALFKKNLLLSWRSKWATFLQLFSSLFFIFLIFCIQKAMEARFSSSTAMSDVHPELQANPPIPPCEDKYYVKLPCYDFVYSGSSSAKVRDIVGAIMANNPGRPIPPNKVRSFGTPAEVDEWLFNNPMTCPGALHFTQRNGTVISYGIQTNSTAVAERGHYEDPTFKFQIPLQIAAEREIARSLIGVPNFSWIINFMEFAHPPVDNFSAVNTVGSTFFLAIAMFGFVLQISSLITEKELKLRQAMTMMGLYDTAYWLSWLTWEGITTLIASLFTVLFGIMFQFDFFSKNNFAVVFLVFFLFQLNMVGFDFLLSAFISKSSSSTTVGFSIFIVGFLTQLITAFGFPYSYDFSKFFQIVWSFFPPNLLAKALSLLSDATSSPAGQGISWSRRMECAPNDTECVITLNDIYIWLMGTFFLWFFLAIYLDNIIPNAAGVRKSAFYFLRPGYWTGKGGSKLKGGICSCLGTLPVLEPITPDDEDVREEENTVKQQLSDGIMDSNVAVQICGLAKTYPGAWKTNCGFCCKCKKTPPYYAVRGLWVNFAKDQLFCLLGPNGAGKTTAISCLTGITPVTGGDASIYGYSVCDSVGMANIRRIVGVCPQFDILWEVLSGKEHLHLFATIKGLPPSSIKSIAEKSLEEVRLTQASKMRAGSYSGGMKRRLSVAIALIGDPKLVILDEPTTGMDPITTRHVWDIIEGAKRGRAVLLTTHSMEEADILSDCIGIMAKGRLRCIGTSIRLKSRFGAGFVANVSFANTKSTGHEEIKQFFKSRLDILPKEEHKSFLTYIIPHDREKLLTRFFGELEERKGELGISDIQLSLTTLEEVFLNIAKQAELESAAADGTMVSLTLTTSGHIVKIPVGSRFVGIPGTETAENPTGIMVEVYWEQDDSGALCISGHSEEILVPPNVQPLASMRSLSLRSASQRHGIVYDPEQVAAYNSH
ncbi:ABC transporter A family member 2-like [Momordica charantia]|uniref:ABC transporter A family member 2-like n=1 Tax=Momordica charantia TaxID=3673 RepID=A0A6J1DYF4_MOMCH|nr:ABC transporter A family member 2-like [Momordica charantia]